MVAVMRRYGPAVGSAVLLCAAFPPLSIGLMVFVALAPLLMTLRDCDGKEALKRGYAFGLMFGLYQMSWLLPFVGEWTGSWALACAPWLLSGLAFALYPMLAAWLINKCWRNGWLWTIPLVWAGVEALRAYMPWLAFPWGNLGSPLWIFPALGQHAAFGTVFLVSAWAVVPNMMLAVWVWPQRDASGGPIYPPGSGLWRIAFAFVALMGLSVWRYYNPPAGEMKVVSVGQPGVDMAFQPYERERAALAWKVPGLMGAAVGHNADLLVLPEGIILPGDSPVGDEPPVNLLVGAQRRDGGAVYQSAFAYDGEWSVVDKTRLVIFGEYVPLRDQLPFLTVFELPAGDLRAGENIATTEIDEIEVGPLLCFEALFPDISATQQRLGAELIAVMAIDDWYMDSWAPEALVAAAVWRSIESGGPMVRSASTGISLATDARGNVVSRAPLGEPHAMRVELLLGSADGSPYRMWVVWALLVSLPVVVLADLLVKRRSVSPRPQA